MQEAPTGGARSALRHGIVAAGMPGMAATEAANAEPQARRGTVPFERDDRVGGTARIEATARAEQRTQRQLVKTHERDEQVDEQSVHDLGKALGDQAREARAQYGGGLRTRALARRHDEIDGGQFRLAG